MAQFLAFVLLDASEMEPARRAYELMSPYCDAEGVSQPPYKFTGCVIGGRFDGLMAGKPQHDNLAPDDYQKRYGLDIITPASNMCWVVDLPEDVIPDAIVTPDGQWHDDYSCTSWDAWKDKAWQLLHEDSTRLAVGFDCHC